MGTDLSRLNPLSSFGVRPVYSKEPRRHPFSTHRKPRPAATPRRGFVRLPRIEALEDRCLLAVVTEFGTGITAGAGLDGITTGLDNNLWFTESGTSKIGQITPSGVVTEFTPGLSDVPLGITTGPDGNLWFSEFAGTKIGRLTTPGSLTEFNAETGNTGGSDVPTTATVGPDGNLWFVTADNNLASTSAVIRVTPEGTVTDFTAGITANSQPVGITNGPDGNLWFTEFAGNQIGKITPAGVVTEYTAAGTPTGIVSGPDGNLWATEYNGNAIIRIDPATGAITGTFTAGITGSNPAAITVGPDGDLWFAEFGGSKIGRLDPTSGIITEITVPTAGSQPFGITLGPDNNLWFTEFGGDKIGRINTAAVMTTAPVNVLATAGTGFTSEVATFTNANPTTPAADYSATIDWGDLTTSTGIVTRDSSGTFHVTGSHIYANVGSDNITVSIQNISTSTTVQQPSTATVVSGLTASGVGNIPTTIGTALPAPTVVATFVSPDPAATSGDFTALINWGDGTVAAGTIAANQSGGFNVTGGHTYLTVGAFSVTVAITDQIGNTATAASTADVSDAPILIAATPIKAVEGLPFNGQVATFTSGNPLATASFYAATIDWGDGSPVSAGTITEDATRTFHVTGSHTYPEEGTFTPVVTVLGVTSTAVISPVATVADAPLSPALGAPISGVEGGPISAIVATFTDANPNGVVADFAATIHWGDGTSSVGTVSVVGASPNGGVFSVFGIHTYAEEGTYPVIVTISDVGGSQTIAATQAVIADAALTGQAIPVSVTENQAFTLPVASFTDADPNGTVTDFKATIYWGDGSPASAGTIVANVGGGFSVVGTHTYVNSLVNGGSGPFTIRTTILDEGGASMVVLTPVLVNDVPIVLTGQLNPSSDSGLSNQDAITNVTQPNFFGNSEPGSTIALFAQPAGGDATVQIAQGVTDASGFWSVTSNLLAQGQYIITAMATDSFGHTTAATTILPTSHPLEIDTAGPKVASLSFNRVSGQIDLTFQDNLSGMDQAQVINAANYALSKLHTLRGRYLVNILSATPGGPTSPEPVVVTINNGRQLRGGIYTFTILSGGIRDVAGNALDGEFYAFFPSGNNVPGGNFVAGLNAVHHTIFAPKTLIGKASPVVPPGTPSTGVTKIPTANPNLPSGNPNLRRKLKARNLHVNHVKVKAQATHSHAIHDEALSLLTSPGVRQGLS
jgi:streptogramin lyase